MNQIAACSFSRDFLIFQVDKLFRREAETIVECKGSNLGKLDGSPRKVNRTFGSSVSEEESLRNTIENKIKDEPEDGILGDSKSKFAREMKMLGHDLAASPNAVKGKGIY